MRIETLELRNFRRFREPLTLSGFSSGLNVVVEPNERGKSTLLEAMRAALFIRHSANTDLTRSYCPIGDNVAPQVALEFCVRGEKWRVEKQFLKSARVRLEGPGGRFESDAAEEQLQRLLGFERGNNKGTDLEARGALGLLWVEQSSALRVAEPGRLVRDNVRSALEGEVGAITGGRRFDLIRENVETVYGTLRTGRTGKSTGRLAAAEERAVEAGARRRAAEERSNALQTMLSALDAARSAKRLVERELGDEQQIALRTTLTGDLKLADTTTERLAAAKARHDASAADAARLVEALARIDAAEVALAAAEGALRAADQASSANNDDLKLASDREDLCRKELAEARAARATVEAELKRSRQVIERRQHDEAIRRALARKSSLQALEAELEAATEAASTPIPAAELAILKDLDRAVIEAGAVVAAGAVKLEIAVRDQTPLILDGRRVEPGHFEISEPTSIGIGEHADIRIIPPGAGAAKAGLASAEEELASALARHGADSYADALDRAARNSAASARATALRQQIQTLCTADPVISLSAGADALRAVQAPVDPADDLAEPAGDIKELETRLDGVLVAEREAIGRHETAIAQMREFETINLQRTGDLAGASRDRENAATQLASILTVTSKTELAEQLEQAQQETLRRLETLRDAEQAAQVFDVATLKRRIANIDAAATNAADRRMSLAETIAALTARIEIEGAKGVESQVAEAREDEVAAIDALARLRQEADTLELLRTTLREAQATASRTFLGPVTRRAVRYVNRILPDCDITFSEELGLTSITRGGVSEGCADLSLGTQEQLAVLTRLAFADMLLDKGDPVSLVLDDPMVYSDDARLETMTEILTEASERMQIILLTCRERAFRYVAGTRIPIGRD